MMNATDVQPCLHERMLVSSEHVLNESREFSLKQRKPQRRWGNDPHPVIDDEGDHVTVLRVRLTIFERKTSSMSSS